MQGVVPTLTQQYLVAVATPDEIVPGLPVQLCEPLAIALRNDAVVASPGQDKAGCSLGNRDPVFPGASAHDERVFVANDDVIPPEAFDPEVILSSDQNIVSLCSNEICV
jgi:hypothetical protein